MVKSDHTYSFLYWMNEMKEQKRLFFDGAFGTDLQKKGLKPGELPEEWNLSHKNELIEHYSDFLNAGCDFITTNTFGANRLHFPENLEEIIDAGVSLAKEAREKTGKTEAKIAFDIGPSGKLLEPLGELPFEEAVALFKEAASLGEKAGADLVIIETMTDLCEMQAAVLGTKEGCDLPIFATLNFNEKGVLLTGGTIEAAAVLLEGLGVSAIGFNCGTGPDEMQENLKRLLSVVSIPVIVQPNAGLPRVENGKTVYDITPEDFGTKTRALAELGVSILGGCCGTTTEHIRSEIKACSSIPLPEKPKKRTFVSSATKVVEIGKRPVIIGERINPTGKKRFQEALRNKDLDYILQQATEQIESGADILDVNVGLPEIDEPEMMEAVVTKLQEITDLPLQLDTGDPIALERGLRAYRGKAMINSVNGEPESIERIMPIVKKYGGVLVGLALDQDGIPKTAEGRMAVAEKIYEAAHRYGIPKEDIVIDGLAMTVSSDPGAAKTTLQTIRKIREAGGHSILGVSNISFGLPQRENVNAAFLCMAMQEGLSCAIMNPNSAAMMRAYRSFNALSEWDRNFEAYLADFSQAPEVKDTVVPVKQKAKPKEEEETLFFLIEKGRKERAADFTKELLKTRDAMEIIDQELIPALDSVGQGFEKGTLFLPQLLMAADSAQAAFAVIREKMGDTGGKKKGKVLLATVKNDIHDIGKNIVKVLLENYGYEVLDLGKDVPAETIADCAVKEKIRLVGLSALMTTTVPSMEETIKLLRERAPETKVVVGGAVMTKAYADMIGADKYAKDAMETVRYADSVFGEGV